MVRLIQHIDILPSDDLPAPIAPDASSLSDALIRAVDLPSDLPVRPCDRLPAVGALEARLMVVLVPGLERRIIDGAAADSAALPRRRRRGVPLLPLGAVHAVELVPEGVVALQRLPAVRALEARLVVFLPLDLQRRLGLKNALPARPARPNHLGRGGLRGSGRGRGRWCLGSRSWRSRSSGGLGSRSWCLGSSGLRRWCLGGRSSGGLGGLFFLGGEGGDLGDQVVEVLGGEVGGVVKILGDGGGGLFLLDVGGRCAGYDVTGGTSRGGGGVGLGGGGVVGACPDGCGGLLLLLLGLRSGGKSKLFKISKKIVERCHYYILLFLQCVFDRINRMKC